MDEKPDRSQGKEEDETSELTGIIPGDVPPQSPEKQDHQPVPSSNSEIRSWVDLTKETLQTTYQQYKWNPIDVFTPSRYLQSLFKLVFH